MPLRSGSASSGGPTQKAPSIVGDPMEQAAFISAGGSFLSDGTISMNAASDQARAPRAAAAGKLRVFKRWPFSSSLKRMTCAIDLAGSATISSGLTSGDALDKWHASVDALGCGNGGGGVRIVCKGAPEALAPLLRAVPPAYNAAYASLSATGARVLALAYRVLPGASVAKVRSWPREEAEQQLSFVGFLVLSSPLKTDSKRTVKELQLSQHRVVMITGDAPLTAVAVAHQVRVEVTRRPCLPKLCTLPIVSCDHNRFAGRHSQTCN
jgi:manganese-transporting P-type ATPase